MELAPVAMVWRGGGAVLGSSSSCPGVGVASMVAATWYGAAGRKTGRSLGGYAYPVFRLRVPVVSRVNHAEQQTRAARRSDRRGPAGFLHRGLLWLFRGGEMVC